MMISVIVPVYNGSRYLADCLSSILAQTYTDFELVAVDDGSTDGSADMLDRFAQADSRVRVVHSPNRGVSHARNLGVETARGEYVAFVDADDMLHPHFLDALVHILDDTGASIASCDFTDNPDQLSAEGEVSAYDVPTAIELTLYQRGINNSVWGKLMPRVALMQARHTEGIRYEDLDVFYRIYEAADGTVACTSAPMYFYRPNQTSFINTFNNERLDVLSVVDRIESHYADNDRLLRAARDRKFSANFNMFALTTKAGLHDQADVCWQVIRRYRASSMLNGRVRLKNRIGALVSYLGKWATGAICGILTR